jgi:hypothetical protein
MSEPKSNNNDDNSNEDNSLEMNRDDDVATLEAPKNAKVGARAKKKASARSGEESPSLTGNAGPKGGPERLKSIRSLTLTSRVKPR